MVLVLGVAIGCIFTMVIVFLTTLFEDAEELRQEEEERTNSERFRKWRLKTMDAAKLVPIKKLLSLNEIREAFASNTEKYLSMLHDGQLLTFQRWDPPRPGVLGDVPRIFSCANFLTVEEVNMLKSLRLPNCKKEPEHDLIRDCKCLNIRCCSYGSTRRFAKKFTSNVEIWVLNGESVRQIRQDPHGQGFLNKIRALSQDLRYFCIKEWTSTTAMSRGIHSHYDAPDWTILLTLESPGNATGGTIFNTDAPRRQRILVPSQVGNLVAFYNVSHVPMVKHKGQYIDCMPDGTSTSKIIMQCQ